MGKMVPFWYIALACAHVLARPSSLAHLNFPLSKSLLTYYASLLVRLRI